MHIDNFIELKELKKTKALLKKIEKFDLKRDRVNPDQIRDLAQSVGKPFEKTWDEPIVISVSNNKGGIAKSTFCVHLAYIFKKFYNLKVLLLSVDPQGNIINSFYNKNYSEKNLYNLIKSYKNDAPENPLDYVVQLPNLDNVDYIPVDMEFGGIEQWDSMDCIYLSDIVNDLLEDKSKEYDCVIIDTPPTISKTQISALLATDYLIIPMESEMQSITGANNVLKLSSSLKRWSNIKGYAGFISMYEKRIVDRSSAEKIIEVFTDKINLFNTKIPRCVAGKEVFSSGKIVFDYEKDDKLSLAYLRLTEEILEFVKNV